MKKAYVFPGQGSQFSGMGKALYESNPKAQKMMEEANDILGFRLTDIMFEGSAEELRQTDVTQPSVFLHSVSLSLCSGLDAPDMVGGHSLGEFSALVASGAMSFENGLKLVAARARAMQKCCEATPGAMAAIIAFPDEKTEEICRSIDGCVILANYNCNGQLVISGEAEAVARACALIKEAGARRVLPLSVGGAFHSPLMASAQEELAKAIQTTPIAAPSCPIYQNVSAKAEMDPARIKENLLKQLTSPVRWTQTVGNMIADGASSFTEIGPGETLQGLVRRICKALEVEGVNIRGLC